MNEPSIASRYVDDGDSLEEIARDYGVHKTTIKRRLEKAGVTLRGKGRYSKRESKAPMTVEQKTGAMWSMYRITPEDYGKLYASQYGGCAICGASIPEEWEKGVHIDHCHESKKVRGLLCPNCNVGLGMFNDDVGLLSKSIEYLNVARGDIDATTIGRRSEHIRVP